MKKIDKLWSDEKSLKITTLRTTKIHGKTNYFTIVCHGHLQLSHFFPLKVWQSLKKYLILGNT